MQPNYADFTLRRRNLQKNKHNNMAKVLRVINPFFMADKDDTFVLSEDGKFYTAEHNEEFHAADMDDVDEKSSFSSTFTISINWAKQLIEEGYLEEVSPKIEKSSNFVNVFDEIDILLKKYNEELKNLPKDMAEFPECVKVERTTVLTNIITVLEHLKSLRK